MTPSPRDVLCFSGRVGVSPPPPQRVATLTAQTAGRIYRQGRRATGTLQEPVSGEGASSNCRRKTPVRGLWTLVLRRAGGSVRSGCELGRRMQGVEGRAKDWQEGKLGGQQVEETLR
ncbi:hypothetical protein P7K49_024291 [Saguinus oedipus]|uniref:Uncharacterized protein n=1 Tax=Saguinus oedipus TaxID=9490 RepID=A0ABQ9UP47_SAGOE|nr:hypothetical protein P7K49_024291 [Saguinus oedipus]